MSRGEIEALDPQEDLNQVIIDRFKSLMRLPLTAAIKHRVTGEISYNSHWHGTMERNLGEVVPLKKYDYGFVYDAGWWLTRQEAAAFANHKGSYPANDNSFISGEEWIPPLNNEEEAIEWSGKMHQRGYEQAQVRLAIFQSKDRHPEYARLLQIAIDKYPISEEAIRNGI